MLTLSQPQQSFTLCPAVVSDDHKLVWILLKAAVHTERSLQQS